MNKNIASLFGIGLLSLSLAACSSGGSQGNGAQSAQGASAGGAASGSAGTNAGSGPSAGGAGDAVAFDPNAKVTIVFSTFWPEDRFEEAKKKYEAAHPNVTIKLESVTTDDSHAEADLEKFRTTTNAAMLAGKGPDLLEMKELPMDSYVQHGLLVNLDEMIKQDPSFHKEDYFANILDNSRSGDGLYGMPLSFFLKGLAGDEDAIAKQGVKFDDKTWSWSDFAEDAQKLVGGTYPHVISTTPEYMLNWLVSDDYSFYVDEAGRKANFDSKSFIDLMEQVKKMGDDGIVGQGQPYFYPIQINSPGDYFTSLKGYLSDNMKLYTLPHGNDAGPGGYFQPYFTVGIGANSKVKPQAWDFLKFLISDQIATSPDRAGFPLNKNAYAKEVQQLKADGSAPSAKEGPLKGASVPVDDAKLDELESYLTAATHPVGYKPSQVQQIVLDESKAFFSGQKSAEAVAKLIQNKVTTYLNE
ncbi:ABC transporter substrate-binding protein [Cohnella zeiphila]|uniref:Extracellular solute-binding protein n=1 Tax=Cohnella zeiphila TaxID=2761120 RepID=A0A7X0SQM7_9BACL|nr:extracellular solute-binding protein [Cohnella zeiphila]MBB6734281.1 extracellular solute-binding protein [Cohnella zeiphila]